MRIISLSILALIFVSVCYGQTASFLVSLDSGCAPMLVHFTNTSTASTAYSWNFGNGDPPSVLMSPSTSYNASGVYTVTLTAYNGSDSSKAYKVITVFPNPTVSFYASDTAACPGTAITFTSTSTGGVTGGITNSWIFGDGGSDTGAVVVHRILIPGPDNVALTVTNAKGCSTVLTRTAYILIYTPPAISFGTSQSFNCAPPAAVTFASVVSGSAPYTYLWTFGDGTSAAVADPVHSYSVSNDYSVELAVGDAHGCYDTLNKPGYIYVGNTVASFTNPDSVCLYKTVRFTNTSSPHSASVWSFGNGRTDTSDNGTDSFGVPGIYTTTLTVTDSLCTASYTSAIYVRPGTAGAIVQSPLEPCPPPTAINFNGTVPAGCMVSWAFGDGTAGVGADVTHTYQWIHVDTVEMIIDNTLTGCTDSVSVYDTIQPITPEFNIFPLVGGCIPLTVDFYAEMLAPDLVDTSLVSTYRYPFTFMWDFGDGDTSSSGTPVHIYTTIGTYNVLFEATSGNGCVVRDTLPVLAGAPPEVTFSISPTPICYDQNAVISINVLRGPYTNSLVIMQDGTQFFDSTQTDFHTRLPGVFTVTVIPQYNACNGDTVVRLHYLTVDSPKAVMHSNITCYPSTSVSFTDGSIGESGRVWYFGDGDSSTISNPVHVYSASAAYVPELIAYNDSSHCRDTTRATVSFYRLIPSFSTTDTAICAGAAPIVFNSSVIGGYVLGYAWYVDSVLSSGFALLGYSFENAGIYSVMLVITDPNNCPDTVLKPGYMHVGKPRVSFTASPPEGCVPATVTFTDGSTDIAGAGPLTHSWIFGDGGTGTGALVTALHTYTATGTNTVIEIVTDIIGCADTDTLSAPVYVFPVPVASFSVSDTIPCPGVPVVFTNTTGGYIHSGFWYFGDGTGAAATGSVTHTYNHTGMYSDTLVVANDYLCTDTAIRAHLVRVTKPEANFHMSDSFSVCPPLTVKFYNTSVGGATYYWNFGDSSHSVIDSPEASFTTSGMDTVSVIVTNVEGCKDTAYSHVSVFGYSGDFSFTPDSGCVPLNVHFSSIFGLNVPHVIWDFSDGITDSLSFVDSVTHVYREPGYYPIRLILVDSSGCMRESVSNDSIRAEGVPALKAIIAGPAVCAGDSIVVTDATPGGVWSSSVPGIAKVGTLSGMVSAIAAGTATITYTAIDVCGSSDTVATITIDPQPDAGFISGNGKVCVGDTLTLTDTTNGGVWRMSAAATGKLTGGLFAALAPGTATIEYTIINECGSDTAVKNIVVDALPYPGAIHVLPIVCILSEDTLTDVASGNAGGVWSTGATIISVDSSTGIFEAAASGTAIITFTAVADTNGCVSDTTAMVTVAAVFDVDKTISNVTCYNAGNGSISLVLRGDNGPFRYAWEGGATTAGISNVQPGTFVVTVTDLTTHCTVTDSFAVTQPDSLQVNTLVSRDTCNAGLGSIVATVTGGTAPYVYVWSIQGNGAELSGLHAGLYSLQVTDAQNCIDTPYYVLEDTCNDIVVHDAITPNGDGINDVWVIQGIESYHLNTVQVFDKWGNLLFEKSDYQNDWGGIDKDGHAIPDGTYFYLIKLNQENTTGGQNVFKGALLIKR